MRKQTISFKTFAICMIALMGSASAQNLSELRTKHNTAGVKQSTAMPERRISSSRSVNHKKESRRASNKRELRKAKKIQRKVDRKLDRRYAKKRNFKSLKEFKRGHRAKHRHISRHARHLDKRYNNRATSRHSNRYRHDGRYSRYKDQYNRWQPKHTQRGYRHYRRSWYMTYRYERASFYDRYGYKYGYFSRRGFMFEGDFYRYDRYYTYRDRLRGRGLFERRYYRPAYSQFGDLFADLGRDGFRFYANFDY